MSQAIKFICDCGKIVESNVNYPTINDQMKIASSLGPCKTRFMGRLTLELGLEGRFNGHTDYWKSVNRNYEKYSEELLEEEFQRVVQIIHTKYGLNSENGDKSSIDIIIDATYSQNTNYGSQDAYTVAMVIIPGYQKPMVLWSHYS